LLVLTVIGVGTLSTVSMQERMASNANLQALAFEAASAGVTETLEQWLDEDNWPAGKTCDRGLNERLVDQLDGADCAGCTGNSRWIRGAVPDATRLL
jgi:Tfp pilus assembly protein PilX